MKNTKKFLLITGVAFTLMSCGSKEEAKVACPCTEVHISHGVAQKDGMPYTGSCEELDQHSVATTHKDYVNGIMVADYHKLRVGDQYFTTDSLTYESGSPYNGFVTERSAILSGAVIYIEKVEEYKDGKKTFDSWLSILGNDTYRPEYRFKYIDMLDHKNGDSEETGTGDLKTSFITYLEKIKKVNPRFVYWVEK